MEVQCYWIEVSGHLHAPVALLPGKEESLVSTDQEVGWSGHHVVHRAGYPVTVPTELSRSAYTWHRRVVTGTVCTNRNVNIKFANSPPSANIRQICTNSTNSQQSLLFGSTERAA